MGSIEDDTSLVEDALLQGANNTQEMDQLTLKAGLFLRRILAIGELVHLSLGMCTLTLSASVPALKPAECLGSVCPPATPAQYAVFYFGLYVVALGTGGVKTCVSSFGADQFDDTDTKERVKKGSFFNWYYFSIYLGAIISCNLIVWIQDNVGWGLGFGIPALFMGLSTGSFFLGTPLYRFQKPGVKPYYKNVPGCGSICLEAESGCP